MNYAQIATLLNNTIVPNILGQGESSGTPITIAENLSNVVDLGTALASMTADQMKNYMADLAVGVFDTFVDSRTWTGPTYDLFLSEQEYGGAIQRVKGKLIGASQSNILTLDSVYDPNNANPTDFTDGKFYGIQWDSRLYDKDAGFKIIYSISTQMFKKSFTSAAGVAKLISMIEATVETTLNAELNGLARGVLRSLIVDAYGDGRYIPLITTYNTKMNLSSGDPGYITIANWSQSTSFKLFVQTCILELRKYITDLNEKYGNGDVTTFTPEEDSRCVLLTEFAAELDVAMGSVYHTEMVSGLGNYRTINYWQNGTVDLLPQIASGSLHDQIAQTDGVTPVTIDHVVGVVYDKYSAFITNKLGVGDGIITTKYVPEEDFTTFFHHLCKSYTIDPRNTAIALTLA